MARSYLKSRRVRRLRWVVWPLVPILIFATALYRRYLTPGRLRLLSQEGIARLTGCDVQVRDAQFALGYGAVLTGVVVREPGSGELAPAIRIERLAVHPRWTRLLRGRFVIKALRAEGLEVNVHLGPDGSWGFLKRFSDASGDAAAIPRVYVHAGNLRISPEQPGLMPDIELAGLNVAFRSTDEKRETFEVSVSSDDCGLGRLEAALKVLLKTGRVEGRAKLSGTPVGPKLRNLLPTAYRAGWDELHLTGLLDTECTFSWDGRQVPALRFAGSATLNEAACFHATLPHPISELYASLDFDNSLIRLGSLRGRMGPAELSGTAAINLCAGSEWVWEFQLEAKGLQADRALHSKLPADARQVWESLNPEGTFNLVIRGKGASNAPPAISADLELLNMACSPPDLPAQIRGIRSRVTLSQTGAEVAGLTGRIGEGWLAITRGKIPWRKGEATAVAGSISDYTIDQAFRDWALKTAASILSPDALAWMQKVRLEGKIDLALRYERAEDGAEPELTVKATFKDCTLEHPAFGKPLTHLSARLEYTDGSLNLAPASAEWGKARLETPPMKLPLAPEAARKISIRLRDLELNDEIVSLLPPRARAEWEKYRLHGLIDLDLTLHKPEGKDQPISVRTLARVQDGSMVYAGFPYPVREIRGHLEAQDGSLRQAIFTGRHGTADLALAITAKPFEGLNGKLITIRAIGAPFDEDLRNALPEEFRRIWDGMKPQGRFDLNLTIQRYWLPDDRDRANFGAEVSLPAISFKSEVALEAKEARIIIEQGHTDEHNATELKGRALLSEITLETVRLYNVLATFSAGRGRLTLDRIEAGCYGGTMTGDFRTWEVLDENGEGKMEFRGSFYLRDASVKRITEERDVGQITGRLNASSDLGGRFGSLDDFTAVGAMTIRDGRIGALPGILSVLNLLQLRELSAPAFHSLELAYSIRGSTLYAHELNLLGNILSLYGQGQVNVRGSGQMDLRFRPQIGPRLPRIPLVHDVINQIKDIVVPVTVAGDYNDPVLRVNPILELTRTVQKGIRSLFANASSRQAKDETGK